MNRPRVRYLTALTGAYASTCPKVSRSKSRSRSLLSLCDTIPKALPRLVPINVVRFSLPPAVTSKALSIRIGEIGIKILQGSSAMTSLDTKSRKGLHVDAYIFYVV